MEEKRMPYVEAIEIASRAATHARKEATAFDKILEVLKMAQAAKTEADLYKATQMKHADLKAAFGLLDGQHKAKSAAQETERTRQKTVMDGDLRSYALKLEGDLKKTKADHDQKMAEMSREGMKLQAVLDAMGREKAERTEALKELRAEAKAHADKAVAAATGAP